MYQLIPLGILLEVTAAGLGTISKQLIAWTENASPKLKKCTLTLGIFLNVIVGPIVDASAYAFAPQTVIAPFASLDVLFNAASAPCTLGWQAERLTWKHFLAAFLVAGGAASSAFFGNTPQSDITYESLLDQLLQPWSIAYYIAEAIVALLAMATIRLQSQGRLQGMALGGVAGLLMGNVFLLKGFVTLFRNAFEEDDWDAFKHVLPYMLLVGALITSALATYFMQWGLRKYKGVYMVTIFEGIHISSGCLSGDIVLGEMANSSWQRWFGYWVSVSFILAGISLINFASDNVELQLHHMSYIQSRLSVLESPSRSPHLAASVASGPMSLEKYATPITASAILVEDPSRPASAPGSISW